MRRKIKHCYLNFTILFGVKDYYEMMDIFVRIATTSHERKEVSLDT